MEIIYNTDFELFEVHGAGGVEYADADVMKCITYRMAAGGAA